MSAITFILCQVFVEPRIIEIPSRILQVFIASLGTCDPKLKLLYLVKESNLLAQHVKLKRYHYINKVIVPLTGVEPVIISLKGSSFTTQLQRLIKLT